MNASNVDVTLRPITPDEWEPYARAISLAFGNTLSQEQAESYRSLMEFDRSLVAFDRDLIVGTTGAYSFQMGVPDADPVACAGVTAVTVRPTHRRRGVLTRLMRRQLSGAYERGDAWAALYASEAPIYGRFGYGVVASAVNFAIDRPWTTIDRPATKAQVELIDAKEAQRRFPPIYEQVQRVTPGMMHVSRARWRSWLDRDPESEREGMTERLHIVVEDRAYATYRVKPRWTDNAADSLLKVQDVIATDAEAAQAAWAYLFGVDLVQHFSADLRPADDPLPWWLPHRDRLRTTVAEPLYVRLLDVGAALASRGYASPGSLVFEVIDGTCPWNAGTWHLEADDGVARCARTTASADMRLDVRELASLALGGVRCTELHRAGLIDELTPGASRRADLLFAADRQPWNPFIF